MKLASLFRGKSVVLRGNFLILTMSWAIMYSAGPIPQTYASLYYLSLGADDFLLSIVGFAGSIAIALVQLPGGYLAELRLGIWHFLLHFCSFMALYNDGLNSTEFMRYLCSSSDGYGYRFVAP
jgi:hypothetical protein